MYEAIGAVILYILFIMFIIVLGGWCLGKGITYTAKTFANELGKTKKRNENYENLEKLWLCPICGYWKQNPRYHLKTMHNIDDDMLEFWIEKGKWI